MNYKLIAAVSKDGGIGKQGHLPWRIKEDLAFFSKMTRGNGNNAVIMGRKTWNSLEGKHLAGRDNYILSSTLDCQEEASGNVIQSFDNIVTLESHIDVRKYDDVWVIGGTEIYKQYIRSDKVDTCYLTFIDESFDCDTFFPSLSLSEWKLVEVNELTTQKEFKVEIKKFTKII
tara:strand:+ start:1526 stop:2044 length:519 start_codon:yes stop_codon:yes gene_type:complete